MNKFLYYLTVYVALVVVIPSTVLAATATPSGTSPSSDTTKKIEDLKDRLATKVAQMKTTQRRAVYGTVKTTSITSFTVETPTRDLKIELTDDITVIQYLKGKRTTLALEDIVKGDTVVVFGQFDTTLDLLTARIVFIQGVLPQYAAGTVTGRDDKEFTLAITTPESQTLTIDIEKTTKTLLWDKEKKELVKSSFSKIATGSTIHIMGSLVPKMEQRISADRILDLGNLTGVTPTATASPTAKPSP